MHRCALGILFSTLIALAADPASAVVHTVHPDGTGDYDDIQQALFFAQDGDIVELTDGVFTGEGNRDLLFLGKAVTLRSRSGDPTQCILDVGAGPGMTHRAFSLRSGEGPGTVVQGLTVRGGYLTGLAFPGAHGGAMLIDTGCAPTIRNCIFEDNVATIGGAIVSRDASPLFDHCVFRNNQATNVSGAIDITGGTPTLIGCRITGNSAVGGGGIGFDGDSTALLRNCTISGNRAATWGGGMLAAFADVQLARTILWGNCAEDAGDDGFAFTGVSFEFTCSIVDDSRVVPGSAVLLDDETVTADPLFCAPVDCLQAPSPDGDYAVSETSPAAPELSACGVRIGSEDASCGVASAPGDSRASTPALRLNGANPVRDFLHYVIELDRAGPVRVELFDVRGARVATLVDAELPAGFHAYSWDPSGGGGAVQTAGVYYLRLQRSGVEAEAVKIVLRP